ncbi:hypothetical protein GCM10009828_047430 [Actinoplanes couchii]|uniref:Uncharacterized protein n=2 Tax=Actinoplanes couchii TaxID=403638 RepID=A0ABQ3XSG9_9ACTN|nr:hypothetical protein Aco03nite_098610 [Actinoplanes couchii]
MYDQYQPPTDPNGGAIALTAKYHGMTFILGLFRPLMLINGHKVPVSWGRTVIPMPAGQYHVHVHVPYLIPPRIGSADSVVPVYPGQVVEVEYRAPIIGWLDGTMGPPPQRHRGMGAGIALMIVPLVALLCVFGLLGSAAVFRTSSQPVAVPTFNPVPIPSADPWSPAPSTSEPAGTGPSSGGATPSASASLPWPDVRPTLKSVPARTLAGPSWAAGDQTYTMDIKGVPFAFRTPPTWGCIPGKIEIKNAKAWVCIDEGKPFEANAPEPDRTKRLQFMLRPCPNSCSNADVVAVARDWFDDGAKVDFVDERTSYVEVARNADGRYILDMSHIITAPDGTKWQLAVGVYSRPETKSPVQKIVNDMLTQAG